MKKERFSSVLNGVMALVIMLSSLVATFKGDKLTAAILAGAVLIAWCIMDLTSVLAKLIPDEEEEEK